MSRIDVVIPCYNYARYLRQCVESVLSQEKADVRVLIIDDCSSDGSRDVGHQLVAQDPRVSFRRHSANRGHIATYNEGLLEWADADLCMLVSADDMLTPGALARAIDVFDEYSNIGFVHGAVIAGAAPANESPLLKVAPGVHVSSGRQFMEELCSAGRTTVWTPSVIARMSLQKKVGGYNPSLPHSGDLEMWLRYAVHADVARLDSAQAFYRTHGENMHQQYGGVADLRATKAAFDSAFARHGGDFPEFDRLHLRALRSLAATGFDEAYGAFASGNNRLTRECLQFARHCYPRYERRQWRLWLMSWIGCETIAALRRLRPRRSREAIS